MTRNGGIDPLRCPGRTPKSLVANRFVQDVLGDEDRDASGDAQGDRVARSAVDLSDVAVLADVDAGEERAALEVVDLDLLDRPAEVLDHAAEQVVGERPGG